MILKVPWANKKCEVCFRASPAKCCMNAGAAPGRCLTVSGNYSMELMLLNDEFEAFNSIFPGA
jgi:hypothetical protein